MIRDFVLTLVTWFVIAPFQAQYGERLAALGAPQAVLRDLSACAREAAPAAVDRALGDWGWAVSTGVQLAIGARAPEAVVVEIAPSCAPAIRAATPFLRDRGA
jgi:hypothetical protein